MEESFERFLVPPVLSEVPNVFSTIPRRYYEKHEGIRSVKVKVILKSKVKLASAEVHQFGKSMVDRRDTSSAPSDLVDTDNRRAPLRIFEQYQPDRIAKECERPAPSARTLSSRTFGS